MSRDDMEVFKVDTYSSLCISIYPQLPQYENKKNKSFVKSLLTYTISNSIFTKHG